MYTMWILSNTCKFLVAAVWTLFIFAVIKGISEKEVARDISKKNSQLSFGPSTLNNNSQVLPSTTVNPLCSSSTQHYSASGQLEEDLLCLPPIPFRKDFKNPCWRSEVSGSLRCIPYFQVIGMDKCGTTDLFDRIAKHPEILQNGGALHKETWWWSWLRYGHRLLDNTKKQYFEDYVHYFISATKTIEKSRNTTTGYHSLITGDGTPMDMWDFTGWPQIPQNRGLQEPTYLTPHLIHHMNPSTKFIIILRNPIDRLYSDYHFLKLHGNTRLQFHQAVEESLSKLKNCEKIFSLRKCLYNRTLIFDLNKNSRIHLGFYSVFLKEWFSVFPREQFLVLKTEEYSKHLYQQLNKVFLFLKVRQLSEAEMTKLGMLASKRKYETTVKKKAWPMLEETRDMLKVFYNPYIVQLYELLKDKKFLWDFRF